jgi:hypothetical protein
MNALEHELELTTRALLASENWSPVYAHAPNQHAELIKQIAVLELAIMRYFRKLKKDVPNLVNWWYYKAQSVQAYNVQVMINEIQVAAQDQEFIKVIFDPIAKLQSQGAEAAGIQYGTPIEMTPTSTTIQDLTTDQVGALIGKTRNVDGQLTLMPVDNPRIEIATGKPYSIDDTTRDLINNAIKKSINLGYSQEEAAKEVGNYIADPARAQMIAETEGVRAYNLGSDAYARKAGYQGKFWTTAGAIDYCQDNADQGVIPIDQAFGSGAMTRILPQSAIVEYIFVLNI